MKNQIFKVILIGGAPMTGKSSIARIIASQLKYGCLSTDDLGEAISSVTMHETHPEFHYMNGLDYRQYYIKKSEDELKEDILNQHKAIWPAIERLIQIHSTWSTPIVIEGWAIHPEFIKNLKYVVYPLFLVAPNDVIEKRIIENDFSKGSTDEGEMRRKYKARSIWFNEKIIAEANRLKLKVFENKQIISLEEIADDIIQNGYLEKNI